MPQRVCCCSARNPLILFGSIVRRHLCHFMWRQKHDMEKPSLAQPLTIPWKYILTAPSFAVNLGFRQQLWSCVLPSWWRPFHGTIHTLDTRYEKCDLKIPEDQQTEKGQLESSFPNDLTGNLKDLHGARFPPDCWSHFVITIAVMISEGYIEGDVWPVGKYVLTSICEVIPTYLILDLTLARKRSRQMPLVKRQRHYLRYIMKHAQRRKRIKALSGTRILRSW
jgi:hypothetical protein